MKFSGDRIEYVGFVTNIRDNIESQVSDESQTLTRLLAQCTGKAKEAIRSCVNLPVVKDIARHAEPFVRTLTSPT